jgi:hypothetical protein
MRVVTRMEDVKEQFERAHSEAVKAFGNGSIFIERWFRFTFGILQDISLLVSKSSFIEIAQIIDVNHAASFKYLLFKIF